MELIESYHLYPKFLLNIKKTSGEEWIAYTLYISNQSKEERVSWKPVKYYKNIIEEWNYSKGYSNFSLEEQLFILKSWCEAIEEQGSNSWEVFEQLEKVVEIPLVRNFFESLYEMGENEFIKDIIQKRYETMSSEEFGMWVCDKCPHSIPIDLFIPIILNAPISLFNYLNTSVICNIIEHPDILQKQKEEWIFNEELNVGEAVLSHLYDEYKDHPRFDEFFDHVNENTLTVLASKKDLVNHPLYDSLIEKSIKYKFPSVSYSILRNKQFNPYKHPEINDFFDLEDEDTTMELLDLPHFHTFSKFYKVFDQAMNSVDLALYLLYKCNRHARKFKRFDMLFDHASYNVLETLSKKKWVGEYLAVRKLLYKKDGYHIRKNLVENAEFRKTPYFGELFANEIKMFILTEIAKYPESLHYKKLYESRILGCINTKNRTVEEKVYDKILLQSALENPRIHEVFPEYFKKLVERIPSSLSNPNCMKYPELVKKHIDASTVKHFAFTKGMAKIEGFAEASVESHTIEFNCNGIQFEKLTKYGTLERSCDEFPYSIYYDPSLLVISKYDKVKDCNFALFFPEEFKELAREFPDEASSNYFIYLYPDTIREILPNLRKYEYNKLLTNRFLARYQFDLYKEIVNKGIGSTSAIFENEWLYQYHPKYFTSIMQKNLSEQNERSLASNRAFTSSSYYRTLFDKPHCHNDILKNDEAVVYPQFEKLVHFSESTNDMFRNDYHLFENPLLYTHHPKLCIKMVQSGSSFYTLDTMLEHLLFNPLSYKLEPYFRERIKQKIQNGSISANENFLINISANPYLVTTPSFKLVIKRFAWDYKTRCGLALNKNGIYNPLFPKLFDSIPNVRTYNPDVCSTHGYHEYSIAGSLAQNVMVPLAYPKLAQKLLWSPYIWARIRSFSNPNFFPYIRPYILKQEPEKIRNAHRVPLFINKTWYRYRGDHRNWFSIFNLEP